MATAVHAQQGEENTLYRCRGADGVTSYQQSPCSAGQLDAGQIKYDPSEVLQRAVPAAPAVAAPVVEADASTVASDPAATQSAPAEPSTPAAIPAPPAAEPPSDAVECLRPDSSTYVRSSECERSEIGGGKVEGYVIDSASGERVWMETITPLRQIQDPARALTRLEACELARLHIAQIRDGKAPGGTFLRDAERVRDRHCD